MNNLRLSLVQGDTRWHDPAANREYYGHLMAPLRGITDLVLLPETFTSGFSNDAIDQAETMDGPTIAWLHEQARKLDAAVCGSVQIRDARGVFNRLCFVTPDGALHAYDKRHLFRYAKEHERYAAGRDRLTVEWRTWRICPMVCYDLLLYVANWPSARAYAWKTLLRARAIENLCFVAGLNRVGTDGNGLAYDGDSSVIDFLGHPLSEATDEEVVSTMLLQAAPLLEHRARFPAMLDADAFSLA
jgi:predicted amidohydrolase